MTDNHLHIIIGIELGTVYKCSFVIDFDTTALFGGIAFTFFHDFIEQPATGCNNAFFFGLSCQESFSVGFILNGLGRRRQLFIFCFHSNGAISDLSRHLVHQSGRILLQGCTESRHIGVVIDRYTELFRHLFQLLFDTRSKRQAQFIRKCSRITVQRFFRSFYKLVDIDRLP